MTLNLVLPVLNGEKASSKDVIISLLAYEQKLSAKQIHARTKRKYALNISYQAVHKTLNELMEKGIIEKKGKEYELNLNWINSLKKFTEQLLSKEDNNLTVLEVINKDISNFYFEDLAAVDRFLLSTREAISTEEKKPLYFYWFHSWIPLFFSKEGYSKMKTLAENTLLYVLIKGDTSLDKWCGQILRKFNQKNFKTNITDFNMPEVIVYEDYIFQVFYPKNIIDEVNKEFKKIKKIEDLDVEGLFTKVFERKVGIPLTVTKNPEIAKQLKEKFEAYF